MLVFASGDPVDPHAQAKFWLSVIDILAKVAVVIMGGIWTVMNYKRGRIHEHKFLLNVSGKLVPNDARLYLLIVCKLTNVGQSVCPIHRRGTVCEVSAFWGGEPERLRIFRVFERHRQLEPGEQTEEHLLMRVSGDILKLVALRMNLRVISEGTELKPKRYEWNSNYIVEMTPELAKQL